MQAIIEQSSEVQGTIFIPICGIGCGQDLLYELRGIIDQNSKSVPKSTICSDHRGIDYRRVSLWVYLDIRIDPHIVAKFTTLYGHLSQYWDKGATRKPKNNRKPLNYNNVLTISSHQEHLTPVEYLTKTKRLSIFIAVSGMSCSVRMMNYLKAMLSYYRHDVLFVGFKVKGALGRVY